ncbi:hypothetical protein GALMADRAFT_254772 [Galerina marginata CBS 339.88]|uniref:Uncharacterized protein n=1 Tax=Galerina marginata (strain CBS 339.88) TaxID=685588 RepID=A0A067SSR1_GALM3|nr:hypothetical protein GALMADRAFT_254772 [Galerina marginata CBS 339.88]
MVSGLPFHGPRRKLVLAFDVGTTYSGISYSILDPGQVPQIKGVTQFPAQEYVSGSSKIPTVLYYDCTGKVRAVGAEAMDEGIYERAEEEKWAKAEWFKLHLRSKYGDGKGLAEQIPPLPLNKTVIEVFADFLKYLFACASSYIQTTHPNGAEFWRSVKGEIDFVLSHPNGWEGTEQSQMRKAAVLAGLIPDNPGGHVRLSFVTEGEASLHFAIRHGLPEGATQKGEGVVIVDAGGGTIDVSSYLKNADVTKDTFQEIAAPQCYFSGSVFISINARLFLQKFLSDSLYINEIDTMVQCFDSTTKLRFRNAEEPQYVRFGSTKDNDPKYNIRYGQLKLPGSDIASFFQPSIDCIVNAVLEQRKIATQPIQHVVLVGGFSASEFLRSKVKEGLAPHNLIIFVPDNYVNKAVSDGAISFYLDRFVRTRIAKFSYGTTQLLPFDPTNPEHQQRAAKCLVTADGEKRVVGYFSPILLKNTQVTETMEYRRPSFQVTQSKKELRKIRTDFGCYRGAIVNPKWVDLDPKNFTKLCTVEADLSSLPLDVRVNPVTKKKYYYVKYVIILLFGLTELKVQVAWDEKGVEKRGPATPIYEPSNY